MNHKIICEELSFFAEKQTLLVLDFENLLKKETIDLLKESFEKVDVINSAEELDFKSLASYTMLLAKFNVLNEKSFDVLKEVRIHKKELSIVVVLQDYSSMIQRLFDIKIESLLLHDYTQDEILQKILLASEHYYMKEAYNELRQEMYFYNLKKDLQAASRSIKNIETQKAMYPVETKTEEVKEEIKTEQPEDSDKLNSFIDNFNLNHEIDDTMWEHISEEITSLNELYEENINKIVLSGFDEHIKYELTEIFARYNSSLLLIPGLEEFAEIFNDVSMSLTILNLDKIDSQSMEVFDMFEYFFDDISKFFEIVMVERQTKNLNYLTDSMKSSVLQLKIKLGLVEFEEEELELF